MSGPMGEPVSNLTSDPEGVPAPEKERLRRWRLVLGQGAAEALGAPGLAGDDSARDGALAALYGGEAQAAADQHGGPQTGPAQTGPAQTGPVRTGSLGRSAPRVARWLGDIRTYFPSSVVRVMQSDAMTRLGLRQLLLEPEMLSEVVPDVHLVSTLLALRQVIPERSRESARAVVRSVTDELERRLAAPTRQAVSGAVHRAMRTRRPRHGDIDWDATIRANLVNYRPELGAVIPERLIGYGRRTSRVEREIVLAIDQSGSMAESVVYASVFASVLASMRSVGTRLVAFDTAVVDLSEDLSDPVDILFGLQLGGGTDIAGALAYCARLVERPEQTVLVLISDLFEGGVREDFLARVEDLVGSGVRVVALLALADSGTPAFDHDNAATLAAMGVPAFACSPDKFPELMAAAIAGQDIFSWASAHDIATQS